MPITDYHKDTTVVASRIPDSLAERLNEMATRANLSRSAFIALLIERAAIDEAAAEQTKLQPAEMEAGA